LLRAVESPDAHMGALELKQLEQWTPAELRGRSEMKLVSASDDAETIVRLASFAGADLIVMGVAAGRNLSESLRGTITERIVQRSGCPVLTVNAYAAGVLPVATERQLATVG